jgi:hypothetical protein
MALQPSPSSSADRACWDIHVYLRGLNFDLLSLEFPTTGNFHLSISSIPIILVENAALVMFNSVCFLDNYQFLTKTSIIVSVHSIENYFDLTNELFFLTEYKYACGIL